MNIDGTNTLLPEADRRGRRRGPHLPAAAPAGGQGPGPRPHRPVHAAGVDRAVAAGRDAAAADQGTAAEPGRTRQARRAVGVHPVLLLRSEEHTSELQSLMRISYAVFCLKKKKHKHT